MVGGWTDGVQAATAPGTAVATVIAPIAIASEADLRFGSFSTTAGGQSVSIAADGARTLTGVQGAGPSQSAMGAARLTVTGHGALTYAITLPTTINLTTGVGDAARTMVITDFRSDPSGTGALTGGRKP